MRHCVLPDGAYADIRALVRQRITCIHRSPVRCLQCNAQARNLLIRIRGPAGGHARHRFAPHGGQDRHRAWTALVSTATGDRGAGVCQPAGAQTDESVHAARPAQSGHSMEVVLSGPQHRQTDELQQRVRLTEPPPRTSRRVPLRACETPSTVAESFPKWFFDRYVGLTD